MCRKCPILVGLVVLSGVICSCGTKVDKLFEYPLSYVTLPKTSVSVTAARLSDAEFPLQDFKIADSIFLARNFGPRYALTAISLSSGDTLANLCRKGSGPDETQLIVPDFDIVDGSARIVDLMNSRYQEIDIKESIRTGATVYTRQIPLDSASFLPYYSARLVGCDSLLCYDGKLDLSTRELTAAPCFSLVNLKDGSCVAEYPVAKPESFKLEEKSSLKMSMLLRFADCLLPDNHTVAAAFYHLPVVFFFDYENASFRGVRIKGVPDFNQARPMQYFNQICSVGDKIYLLYSGLPYNKPLPEKASSQPKTKILQMDTEGNIIQSFELDDYYCWLEECNGNFYLTKAGDESHLYVLNL